MACAKLYDEQKKNKTKAVRINTDKVTEWSKK